MARLFEFQCLCQIQGTRHKCLWHSQSARTKFKVEIENRRILINVAERCGGHVIRQETNMINLTSNGYVMTITMTNTATQSYYKCVTPHSWIGNAPQFILWHRASGKKGAAICDREQFTNATVEGCQWTDLASPGMEKEVLE